MALGNRKTKKKHQSAPIAALPSLTFFAFLWRRWSEEPPRRPSGTPFQGQLRNSFTEAAWFYADVLTGAREGAPSSDFLARLSPRMLRTTWSERMDQARFVHSPVTVHERDLMLRGLHSVGCLPEFISTKRRLWCVFYNRTSRFSIRTHFLVRDDFLCVFGARSCVCGVGCGTLIGNEAFLGRVWGVRQAECGDRVFFLLLHLATGDKRSSPAPQAGT